MKQSDCKHTMNPLDFPGLSRYKSFCILTGVHYYSFLDSDKAFP